MRFTRPVVAVILMFIATPQTAWAYLDPGTGSMLLQLLLGGIAGALIVAKLYWRRFRGLFRREKTEQTTTSPSERNQ